jgi:heme-degrading monooxygenase HmoA
LLRVAQTFLAEKSSIEIEIKETGPDGGVVEVIVTKVKPGKEEAYRQWETKIQQAQSKFPGYQGSYVQPPIAGELGWTTLMRFKSTEQLDTWLKSPAELESCHAGIAWPFPYRDARNPISQSTACEPEFVIRHVRWQHHQRGPNNVAHHAAVYKGA